MKKRLKSTPDDLKNRGFADAHDIANLAGTVQTELYNLLVSETASVRSAAAYNIFPVEAVAVQKLLEQLVLEKCLYTKIAICEALSKGNIDTAKEMIQYIGKIGNNQHNKLAKTVSKKKSFPLPRDIVARTLSKMHVSIFPLLLEKLENCIAKEISELLDAIGFIAFYNNQLAIESTADKIIDCLCKHKDDDLIVWKVVLCLSAFSMDKSVKLLEEFSVQDGIIGEEARRSLLLIKQRENNDYYKKLIFQPF